MEQVKLYCAGVCRGEITLRPEGGRTEVLAVMPDPGDGLYRVELLGERGGLMLGVMEPAGRELTVCRRLYSRDVAGLGRLLRGEARCSFRFGDGAGWRETSCPAQLFRSSFLHSRLKSYGRAWWRREGNRLLLALPLEQGKPFPLEAMFCFSRVERVAGCRCAVYAFDGQEEPVL